MQFKRKVMLAYMQLQVAKARMERQLATPAPEIESIQVERNANSPIFERRVSGPSGITAPRSGQPILRYCRRPRFGGAHPFHR